MSHVKALVPLEMPAFGQAPRLSEERCRSILASVPSGYLALSQNALPFVVPVTCVFDGDALLVRAGLGLLGKVRLQPGVVAFETGGASIDGRSRWEVMVQGRCELTEEAFEPKRPPQLALVDPSLTTVLRVRIEVLMGWQYGEYAPSLEHSWSKKEIN
jgi:hypothetical protein